MPHLQIFTVDAFTSQPFSGNPAAVVPLTQALEANMMQQIATEMNLSETAFVQPLQAGGDAPWVTCSRYSLRWFTPNHEIPLCGHATLATAHVLFNNLGHAGERLQFETLSGVLVARREGDNIVMDFPSNVATELTDEEQQRLTPVVVAASGGRQVQEVLLSRPLKYLLIRLPDSCSREELETLTPDFRAMERAHDGSQVMAVIVTVAGGGGSYQAVSRFFAPWYGVDEDPVTGSAHTVLGPYWASHLAKEDLLMRQCGRRGGDVKVTLKGGDRVDLGGPAVTLIQGHITL